jgi:PKD repeat protein
MRGAHRFSRALVVCSLALAIGALACGRTVGGDNVAPEADAGGDRFVVIDEPARFDASASVDPDGELRSFRWVFPDGEEEGAVVERSFGDAGRYVVALVVVDDAGAEDRDEIVVTVTGAAPSPSIATSPSGDVRLFADVTFDASGTTSRESVVAWRWSFGDGKTATGEVVTHAFERTGDFTVRLEVEDAAGATAAATVALTVLPLDVDGTWTLSATPATFSCSSYDASFDEGTITLTLADDGETLSGSSPSGAAWQGTLDGADIALEATQVLSTSGSCPDAPVTTTISATLTGDDAFDAQVTRYYDLGVPCQCSALFTVAGTR